MRPPGSRRTLRRRPARLDLNAPTPTRPPNQKLQPCRKDTFYLAGFTKSGTEDGELYVLDQRQRRQWKSTPAKSAYQKGFHTIATKADGDPMVVERTLGEIESKCSRVIRHVIDDRKLPDGDDLDILVNFVALMAVRVPAIRSTISGFIDTVSKKVTRAMLGSERGWQQFKRAYEASGQEADFTREEMKAFVDSDDYTVNFDQSWHVGMMLELGSVLVPALVQRKWSIWIAEDEAPDLICSDRSVCLMWYTSEPPPLPPGFAHHETAVIMPISRRIAIAGTFEDHPPRSMLDRHDVATVNRSTREYANQLYSSEPDFVWAMTDERIGNASELLETLRLAHGHHDEERN